MNTTTGHNSSHKSRGKKPTTVPRDQVVDGAENNRSDSAPSPDRVNPRDEEIHTDREKPLVTGSRETEILHDNRRRAPGQLDVGTAGDAARPTKPGIHGKPLAPRGDVQPRQNP
jgi:hypothetical protein